jgi:hypothetical protein
LKSSNPKEFWKLLEKLNIKGHNYTDPSDSIPAQAWQDHFSCLLNENKTLKFDNSTQKLVDEFINNYDMKPLTKNINIDYRITEEEIIKCIRQLKSGKSSGTDSIKNEMLKVATPYIMCHLVKLFNSILNSGKFPANWSHSLITPFHKSGKMEDPNNYRGIAVTSCLGKLFLSVLVNRLDLFCDQYKLLMMYKVVSEKTVEPVIICLYLIVSSERLNMRKRHYILVLLTLQRLLTPSGIGGYGIN